MEKKNECPFCGAYKPAGIKVCAKCNNNPKLAKLAKNVSHGTKTSLVMDDEGRVVKKILGR